MAKFLTRRRIVGRLEEIINEADRELFLVSPYIKPDEGIRNLLKNKKRSTDILVIYGKKKLRPEQEEFFEKLGVKLRFLENLHAKVYLNENEALVTSMNLYDYSLENNDEMGILVSKADEPRLYTDVYDQVKGWSTTAVESTSARSCGPSSRAKAPRRKNRPTPVKKPSVGYCIRCKAGLAANPEKPYCPSCFKSWNQYKNESYEEKYCHVCGKAHESTLLKPLCGTCYRKHKNDFKFVISQRV